MREIEFRGKRKDNDEWVYGNLITMRDGVWIAKQGYEFTGIDSKKRLCGLIEVIPETVGQYTGVEDKNGKKIYGGDIIELRRFIVIHIEDGEVIYENGAFRVRHIQFRDCSGPVFDTRLLCEFLRCKVIGNIHDNPKMLKEKQEAMGK